LIGSYRDPLLDLLFDCLNQSTNQLIASYLLVDNYTDYDGVRRGGHLDVGRFERSLAIFGALYYRHWWVGILNVGLSIGLLVVDGVDIPYPRALTKLSPELR
jgi:hypothetical protein